MSKIKRLEELLNILEIEKCTYFWNKDTDNESLIKVDNAIEELVCCLENSIYELKEQDRELKELQINRIVQSWS
tara:strand:- start:1710 stop:1931 length:222 start_codon:yes stop_codon:yes gene_type:complete